MSAKNLYQMLTKSVMQFPNRPLFYLNNKNFVTYGDFMKSVSGFRQVLKKNKISKGDNIVIIGNNSYKWASLTYAVWAEGGAIVPMYEKQNIAIKKYVINQTNPKMLFNTGEKIGLNFEINHDNLVFTENTENSLFLQDVEVNESSMSAILYTSGTTGSPKGVMLTHSNILSNINSTSVASSSMEINHNDKYVSFLPWSHCYGLNCELNYLISKGASTYLNSNLFKLRDDFVEHKPTVLCGVPKLFTDIDKKMSFVRYFPSFMRKELTKKIFGPNLRFAMVGGASIHPSVLDYYHSGGVSIYQGYGMTETSPLVSSNTLNNNKVGSVGKLLDCNTVKIVDNEVYVEGKNVSTGYYKHENHESFVMLDGKNYFKSGDAGYIDEHNYLHITGRIKETYKLSNGKFINPDEIERMILRIPEVTQVMIYAKQEDEFNRAIVVTNLTKEKLKEKIDKLKLDKFKIPKLLIVTSEQFTLDNGLVTPKQSLRRKQIVDHFNL